MVRSSFQLFLLITIISTCVCRTHFQKRDAQDDAYWNDAVGSIVREMTKELLAEEGEYTSIADFRDTFGGKLLDGKLTATGGSIGNFSTLRFVNISVSTTPDSLTVYVQVKLDQLEISYSSFEASVRILSLGGSFIATVGSHLLTAQLRLRLDDDVCEAALEILELSEFENINLRISGVDYVNEKLVNKIANMVINKFTPELKPLAEEKLKELVLPYVSFACEYWS